MTSIAPAFLDPTPAEALDGVAPLHAAAPTTVEEIADLVRWARAERIALVPAGGGTERPFGNLLSASRWVSLRSEGRAGIVSFERADMVATVRPGTTLAQLQAELGEAGQFYPNDSPLPERATIGGIVAANRQGLLRPLYGTPRDRVLGLGVVTGEGVAIRGGGRTVKNVAGYDMCKLFTGSRGALGYLTEVTLRCDPLPAARLHVVYRAADIRQAVQGGLAIHMAHLQPAYLVAANRPYPLLAIGIWGAQATVDWQAARIAEELKAAGLEPADGGPSPQDLANRTCPSAIDAPMAGRAAVPVAKLLDIVARLEGSGAALDVQVANGIIHFALDTAFWANLEGIAGLLPRSANLAWTRLPAELKRDIDVWGGIRSAAHLMRGIKDALDPDGVFAPGRVAGRL